MSNCQERIDDDLEYFYDKAEKIGKRPTEIQEDQFISRVYDLVRVENISDIEARRVAFAEIFNYLC